MHSDLENLEMVKYLKKNDSTLYENAKWIYGVCENLLIEIPKTFSNYTIHNIGHSIRIISYMNDLIKDRLKRFSCLHIAIMIYVALLHDTGMVVPDDEKEKLYSEFATHNPDFIKKTEQEKTLYLQNYIRINHGKRVRAVLDQKGNEDAKIKSRLHAGDSESYDFSDIVADICQAHMEDTEWIRCHLDSDRTFGKYDINPQHIAVMLRLGDMLDIDDRRAPYVLFNLLNPQGRSETEWKKHIPITNYDKIKKENNRFIIQFKGECSDPEVFRTVIEYIDTAQEWLSKDLALCSGNYSLDIALPIQKNDIKTKGFASTLLTFSLDYKQITTLLMGERIYSSKKDGLRELIQNAIDAVLLMKNIIGKKAHGTYKPTVGIEIKRDKKQIVVFDNGVGMSEDILANYFFKIGNSFFESNEFKNGNYTYNPIGHFGIGFLACFMLSSKVTIETKHYSEKAKLIRLSLDKKSPYIISYPTDGELFAMGNGTRIIMEYDQIIPNVFPDEESIKQYVKDTILFNNFEFKVCDENDHIVELKKLSKTFIYEDDKENIDFEYKAYTYEKAPDGSPVHYPITHDDSIPLLYNIYTYLYSQYSLVNKEHIFLVDTDNNYDASIDYGTGRYFMKLPEFISLCLNSPDRLLNFIRQGTLRHLTAHYLGHNYPERIVDKFIVSRANEIEQYYKENHQITGYFDNYLKEYIQDKDELIIYEIPYFEDVSTLDYDTYLSLYRTKGLSVNYGDKLKYIVVLSKHETLNKQQITRVMKMASIHWSPVHPLYPIEPVVRKVQVLRHNNSHMFIVPKKYYGPDNIKMYLKGIHVQDTAILPYVIDGFQFESIIVNLHSCKYKLDVSRDRFDLESKEEIQKKIACAIFSDIMKWKKLSDEEKQLIQVFLQIYYGYKLHQKE